MTTEAVGQTRREVAIFSVDQSRAEYLATCALMLAPAYGVTANDILKGHSRRASECLPRQIIMWKCREQRWALNEIGDLFGGFDHSTVFHAHRKIDLARRADAEIARYCGALPDHTVAGASALDELYARRARLSAQIATIDEAITSILFPVTTRVQAVAS